MLRSYGDRSGFAVLTDKRYRLAYRDNGAFSGGDVADDAVAGGIDFHRGLVSLNLEKQTALLDGIAFLHMPLGNFAGGHVHIDLGQYDFDRHGLNPALHQIANLLDDSRGLRHRSLFEGRVVGNGRVDAAKPENWRIEIIKGFAFGNQRAYFSANA